MMFPDALDDLLDATAARKLADSRQLAILTANIQQIATNGGYQTTLILGPAMKEILEKKGYKIKPHATSPAYSLIDW